MTNLPPEILLEISNYIDQKQTLYSCILINKQWHNINIPFLWKNPFYSYGSMEILINCLLVEDKEFLAKNNIKLYFKLLKKPPLHNYAKFTTELCFGFRHLKHNKLMNSCLGKRLIEFILDHAAFIKKFEGKGFECQWPINYHRFDACFQNLYELDCQFFKKYELLNKLANTCKNIKVLRIDYEGIYFDNIIFYLVQLIRAQKQIKKLDIYSRNHMSLSDDLKGALLLHSNSIIDYKSNGKNISNNLLISKFQNLKILRLSLLYNDTSLKYLKSVILPKIEYIYLKIDRKLSLIDLSDFIKINGKTLKLLDIDGEVSVFGEKRNLGELLQSIGEYCKNLEYLSTFYYNKINQKLIESIFNNCVKLKYIKFITIEVTKPTWDINRILGALIHTLPINLNMLDFKHYVNFYNDKSLDTLMDNWKGPKPLKITLAALTRDYEKDQRDRTANILKKYQDLGFLKYKFT